MQRSLEEAKCAIEQKGTNVTLLAGKEASFQVFLAGFVLVDQQSECIRDGPPHMLTQWARPGSIAVSQ